MRVGGLLVPGILVVTACGLSVRRSDSSDSSSSTAGSDPARGGSGGAGSNAPGKGATEGARASGGTRSGVAGSAATDSSGDEPSGSVTGGTQGMTDDEPEPLKEPITSCDGDFEFLGRWVGSDLDFYFEPVQTVALDFALEADGDVVGHIAWGSGEPPPSPTSPDEPWPPGWWDGPELRGRNGIADTWPGFAYTILRGAGCDSSLRFNIATGELLEPWCALQTPVETPEYGWHCAYLGGGSGSADETTCTVEDEDRQPVASYPLWKCSACGVFRGEECSCAEDGCRANLERTYVFELTRSHPADTDVLTGKDPTCVNCTLRLERR